MRNLKKLSRRELKNVNGGIETCIQNCKVGFRKCCIPRQAYYCVPQDQMCM